MRVLVTEILKVENNFSPEIMKHVCDFQEPYYDLRSETSQFRRITQKQQPWHTTCQIPRIEDMGHGTSKY